ncbi:unnamed protein product [Cladocopium goreaui]|uniref:Prolyl 4-hydroxylase alpha subunit domain-containing protein n=1 Tax=Cladocopium goreaui TaxID=2562237 RepID=A0A9P1FEL9_9DINO|nr:unnamed protein product [Cladocopium goreaui]
MGVQKRKASGRQNCTERCMITVAKCMAQAQGMRDEVQSQVVDSARSSNEYIRFQLCIFYEKMSASRVRSLDLFTAAAHIGVMSSSEYRFPKALVKAILMQAKRQLAGADDISESSVRKLCEEIERPLERRSLCAPLCSATCGGTAKGIDALPLSWARPEQEVWVLREVLKPSEVQAIREWGLSRADWVQANGLAAAGLNEHLRFLRYGEGHYFAPHQDGENRKDCGRSVFSALLYLSDSTGCDDGSTRFVSPLCHPNRRDVSSII